MNEEIKETIRAFKLAEMFPFRKLKISRKNVKILSNYIENIEEQNTELKDNWNKLKEYAKENLYFYSGYQGEDLEEDLSIKYLLDKMQEIEGGMND